MIKTVYAYNKYFYEFLKEIKHACKDINPDLYKDLKARYTVRDSATPIHIDSFTESCTPEMLQCIATDVCDIENILDMVVLDTYTLGKVRESCQINNMNTYILLFTYLGIVYKKHTSNEEELLAVLGECQNSKIANIENIIDDDLSGVLRQIRQLSDSNDDSTHPQSTDIPSNFEETLSNSSIGSLAREIAQDIDIDGLNIDSPEDLFKGENSKVIGDIVNKVTSNLQTKIKNGSLNQEQIMQEAMSLMGSMGNNDMLKNMMNAMGSMGMGAGMGSMDKHSSSRARDRLSKKLAQKKK
jgi:hypothetical protein